MERLAQAGPESTDRKTITSAFHRLTLSDAQLVDVLAAGKYTPADASHLKNVAEAVARCSFASKSHAKMIGTLTWLVLRQKSAALNSKFVMYLKTLYDTQILADEPVRSWFAGSYEQVKQDIPEDPNVVVTEADIAALKKNAEIFMQWLDKQNEEDDDEEDDDDEEEEED